MNYDFVPNNLNDLISYHQQHCQNQKLLNFRSKNQEQSITSDDFCYQINNLAWGLLQIANINDKVAIYCYQGASWLICDLAIMSANLISVPIFSNINQQNLVYQLEFSASKIIFTDNSDFAKNNQHKFIIVTIGFCQENCYTIEQLSEIGAKQNKAFADLPQAKGDDVATIVFTSGTTNKPKGVQISHVNLLSQVQDAALFFPLNPIQKALSYLPLAHIFERMVVLFYLTQGISIYFVDDLKNISNYLSDVKPNLLTTVPRVLEKIFAKINAKAEKGNFLLKIAINRAINLPYPIRKNTLHNLLDFLVYKKIRQIFGGNVDMIICGGSALSAMLENFFHNVGLPVYCGYGLTEASPVLSANCPSKFRLGSVGTCFHSVQLKIAEDGELLAKGDNIMLGYLNLAQENSETIRDGWLCTGDLATIDQDGFVYITGRKKEMLKTSNGKYVVPSLLQQQLQNNIAYLLGSLIIAENKRFVSALLFFDPDSLPSLQQKLNFSGTISAFLQSDILCSWVQKAIDQINQNLDNWQQIKKFVIAQTEISIDGNQITPSLKLKRAVLEQQFACEIEKIYS